MKKRMFLSTILMTLVLLVAVTTATFAWYKATGASASAGTASTGTVNVAGNAYTESMGTVAFTPTLTATNVTPVMTDKDGVVKYHVGPNLVVDNTQSLVRHASATISISSDIEETADATVADLYAQIGAETGYKYCIVTITTSDVRVKLFKDEPQVKEDGYKGAATLSYYVQIDTLTTTSVLAAQTFYWAYNGEDGGTADTSIPQITLTATVTFSDTAPAA